LNIFLLFQLAPNNLLQQIYSTRAVSSELDSEIWLAGTQNLTFDILKHSLAFVLRLLKFHKQALKRQLSDSLSELGKQFALNKMNKIYH